MGRGARNFCNKLWNATRFALLNGATVAGDLPAESELSSVDRWILSRLQHTIAAVDEQFEAFEFGKACDELYHFAWDDVCDWYVELAKPVLNGTDTEAAARSRRVLGHVLEQLLKLLHPVIPFVTDELWSSLTRGDSVMVSDWPVLDKARIDDRAEEELAALQRVVTEVRRFRSDQGLKPGQRVAARLDVLDSSGIGSAGIGVHETLIRSLVRLEQPGTDFTATATLTVTGGVTGHRSPPSSIRRWSASRNRVSGSDSAPSETTTMENELPPAFRSKIDSATDSTS